MEILNAHRYLSPGYNKIVAPRGTTILDAAQRAGINMNVVCGGQGKCGKCVVYVQSGQGRVRPAEIRAVLY